MNGVRVVSLVPSFTETLRAWGLDPVACTRFCEQPDLTTVGGTKNPDIEAIAALTPDLVLVDVEENRKEDAAAIEAAGLELFVSDVRSLEHVAPTLRRLADRLAMGDEQTGLDCWAPVEAPPAASRRAFIPIWRRPWMALGASTYGTSVLAQLGVANVLGPDDGTYPEVELPAVAARAPDLVLAPSEPYEFSSEHLEELAVIAPVVEIDGQDLFWWGARTPAALVRLAAQISQLG